MPDQDLVNGRGRQVQVVQADQFNTEPLDSELAFPAQAEDEVLLRVPDLCTRRVLGPAAFLPQARFSGCLMPPQPLAQRQTRDAEPTTDSTGVPEFAPGPNPLLPEADSTLRLLLSLLR